MKLWRRFCADQQGNMAIMFAAGFIVASIVGAIAVDAAAIYHERRGVQNGVDLAALAAANNPAAAQSVAYSALMDAGLMSAESQAGLTVVIGNYNPDPTVAVESRFVANKAPTNAVRVSFSKPGTLFFANGWAEPPTLDATATATVTPQVAFSIGSRLASVNGGVANAVLNGLLGANISLSALDYNGLVNAKVDLFGFLDALATELGVSVGSYNDLLTLQVNHGQLARALAQALSGTDRVAATVLGNALGHNGVLPLNKLLTLGQLGSLDIGSAGQEGLFAAVSALDLLSASAGISDGTHQLKLNVNLALPGVATVVTDIAVGEPPQGGTWYAIGNVGTPVRTAQARVRLATNVLGGAGLDNSLVRVAIYLELAHSEAIAGAATCPSAGSPKGSATILVRPGALRLALGEVADNAFGAFNTQPTIGMVALLRLQLLLLKVQVSGRALVEIAQTAPVSTAFSSTDIANGVAKTVKTRTVVSSLTSSLLKNLKLEVDLLGLGIGLDALTGLLAALILPVTPALDGILVAVTDALGLSIGEADVRVYGVRCTQPVLVG